MRFVPGKKSSTQFFSAKYCFYTCKMSKAFFLFLFITGFFLADPLASSAQNTSKANVVAEDSLKAAIRYRDSLLHKAKKSDTSITSQCYSGFRETGANW